MRKYTKSTLQSVCDAVTDFLRETWDLLQRESELLGADLIRHHTRENLVVGAKFLTGDLPYFVELLAEVATMTEFKREYCLMLDQEGGNWC